jgi:hypothetical protein
MVKRQADSSTEGKELLRFSYFKLMDVVELLEKPGEELLAGRLRPDQAQCWRRS